MELYLLTTLVFSGLVQGRLIPSQSVRPRCYPTSINIGSVMEKKVRCHKQKLIRYLPAVERCLAVMEKVMVMAFSTAMAPYGYGCAQDKLDYET